MSDQQSQQEVRDSFFTPERFAREQVDRMAPPRGELVIAGCRSGSYLSTGIVQRYEELLDECGSAGRVLHLEDVDAHLSDSETVVRLEHHVGGYDAYLVQALFDPTRDLSVDQNYMALLVAARTFREHGAAHVTAVVPYLAYSRQDKPTKFMREPTTARLMADLSVEAGIDRLITWDPHCGQIRGFYGSMPANMLESLTLFIEEFERFRGRDDVIAVAPDAGASKFITHFGRALGLRCAIASKFRPQREQAEVSQIIGDFEGRTTAVILDDMISGCGTIYALVERLRDYGIREVYVGVSHNLCVGLAKERLEKLHAEFGLKQVVVTNTIPQTDEFRALPFVKVRDLSDILARTINRIHYNRSVSEAFYRPHSNSR